MAGRLARATAKTHRARTWTQDADFADCVAVDSTGYRPFAPERFQNPDGAFRVSIRAS